MDPLHLRAEQPAQVHHRAGAVHGVADRSRIGDVGTFEAELPDLAERLDEEGLARIALGNPHPDAALQQSFADVAADESAAAEDGYKLFRPLDHVRALASRHER